MAFVYLNSDFVDGTADCTGQVTDCPNLMTYQATNEGKLWTLIQSKRITKSLTTKRMGPGVLWFVTTDDAHQLLKSYLDCDDYNQSLQLMRQLKLRPDVSFAFHIGHTNERGRIIDQARPKKGFG